MTSFEEFQNKYIGRSIVFKGFEDYESVFEDDKEQEYYRSKEGVEGLIVAVDGAADFDETLPEENQFDSALFDIVLDDGTYFCTISGSAIEVIDAFPEVNLLKLEYIAQKYGFKTPSSMSHIDLYDWAKRFLLASKLGLLVQDEDKQFVQHFYA